MNRKKIAKGLLFPPITVMILMTPPVIAFLVCSMAYIGSGSAIAIISYVLSAYMLTVWCFRIPRIIAFFRRLKSDNKFVKRWFSDRRLRVNVSLYGSLIWNAIYGVFQLWLGFYHHTFWFCSFAIYYFSLAAMRLFLVRYTRRYNAGENMRDELVRYRFCGITLLIMNLALSLIIFFMIYWNRTFHHHQITAIAMAAYTFTAFTIAIVSIIKYRKYNSPAYSASKAISLAAACVSLLTLSSTMLTTFGGGTMTVLETKIMLGAVGGGVSLFIIMMAVYIIVESNKKLTSLKQKEISNGE